MMELTSDTIKLDPAMYDTTKGYDDDSGIKYALELSEDERKYATILYRYFNELWGIIAVKGDPGTGKDLFGNWLQHTLSRYFPSIRKIRDEKPRILFGKYDSLFNDTVLHKELEKMREVAKGNLEDSKAYKDAIQKAADDWVSSQGIILLQRAIIYLTEWWRYCNKREPFSPMNKTMGGIHKEIRHINSLIIGTTQLISDLDKYTCKPFINWQVSCGRSGKNWSTFNYLAKQVHYEPRLDILEPIGKELPITIDGAKPRSYLGDGKIIIRKDRYKYDPENEEERIVLDVIKADYNTYESIVELIYDKGDMTEEEILITLKELKYRKYKRILSYPDFFTIYNSRSAPNITTSIKVEA